MSVALPLYFLTMAGIFIQAPVRTRTKKIAKTPNSCRKVVILLAINNVHSGLSISFLFPLAPVARLRLRTSSNDVNIKDFKTRFIYIAPPLATLHFCKMPPLPP